MKLLNLVIILFLTVATPAMGQFLSTKTNQNETNVSTNRNENIYLNTSCSVDSSTCSNGANSTEYDATTNSEKRTVNKYYSRLNGRISEPSQDCYLIPASNENQADHHQQLMQQKILGDYQLDGNQNSQVDAQRALRRSHITRQDTSLIQGTGWGAATVCQGALMAYGIKPSTLNNSLDFAASGGLALYHAKKYNRNVAYGNQLEALIEKLPDSKNCDDPNQNRTCFCSKPQNYNKANCLPTEYVSRAGGDRTPIGCVDANGSVDPKCECIPQNNCADKVFKNLVAQNGFAKFANHEAVARPGDLFLGSIGPNAGKEAQGSRAAFGLKLLKKSLAQVENRLRKEFKPQTLTPEQEEDYKTMLESGVPSLIANYFASQPDDPGAREKFLAQLAQDPNKVKIEALKIDPKLAEQVKQEINRAVASVQPSPTQEQSADTTTTATPTTGLDEKQQAEIANLIEEDAKNRNQIHQDSDKGLFQIISHRYRLSAYPSLTEATEQTTKSSDL